MSSFGGGNSNGLMICWVCSCWVLTISSHLGGIFRGHGSGPSFALLFTYTQVLSRQDFQYVRWQANLSIRSNKYYVIKYSTVFSFGKKEQLSECNPRRFLLFIGQGPFSRFSKLLRGFGIDKNQPP